MAVKKSCVDWRYKLNFPPSNKGCSFLGGNTPILPVVFRCFFCGEMFNAGPRGQVPKMGSDIMVESEHDAATGEKTIVLRPNGSLNRRQGFALLAFCALLMGAIGGVFALLGAWLVLPFSGLEWLLLAYCLHLSRRHSAEREVITITDALVRIEKGRESLGQTYKFQRAWVRLDLSEPPARGRPSRLSLRLHGKEVEIGRFLVESERQALAKELKALLSSR